MVMLCWNDKCNGSVEDGSKIKRDTKNLTGKPIKKTCGFVWDSYENSTRFLV